MRYSYVFLALVLGYIVYTKMSDEPITENESPGKYRTGYLNWPNIAHND
jgi:hypothetical protein